MKKNNLILNFFLLNLAYKIVTNRAQKVVFFMYKQDPQTTHTNTPTHRPTESNTQM